MRDASISLVASDFLKHLGSAQRIAMRILDLPKDKREAALEMVRRIYTDELKKYGAENQRWINLQIGRIRSLIAEIESSGGRSGGHT